MKPDPRVKKLIKHDRMYNTAQRGARCNNAHGQGTAFLEVMCYDAQGGHVNGTNCYTKTDTLRKEKLADTQLVSVHKGPIQIDAIPDTIVAVAILKS